ncbi:MAG: long-chain fatty acid transporter [Chryseolinea sp.]
MIKVRGAIILCGILLLAISTGHAQTYVESALLFSQTKVGGSSRIQAMGGSQTALGGDYSSAFSNPAGLGMFNRSEVTFTPAVTSAKTTASYLGNVDESTKTRFNIPGISFIFNMPMNKGGFVSGSFGISLNRTNDFNRSTFYHGRNVDTSIIDYFIDDAFGSDTDQFAEKGGFQFNTPTGLAYYNYLIGPLSIMDQSEPDDEYFSDVKGVPDQQEIIQTKGSSNQWNFSYGANFKDMLFIGAGIGITSLKYTSEKNFSEDFDDDDVFNRLGLNEYLDLKGNGINATVGAIVRPQDFLQLGVSFTTPTYYEFSETYSANMATSWKNFDYYGDGSELLNNEQAATDIVTSDYSLVTPLKVSSGVAFISKYGIITGDVEFTNPSKARYSSNISGIEFSQENKGIKAAYQSVVNYRIGGEFRYEKLRVRAGYGVQGSSYSESIALDNSIKSITGGVGVRFQKFYADFALVHSSGKNSYNPYSFFDGINDPVVDLKTKILTGMLTFGFAF